MREMILDKFLLPVRILERMIGERQLCASSLPLALQKKRVRLQYGLLDRHYRPKKSGAPTPVATHD